MWTRVGFFPPVVLAETIQITLRQAGTGKRFALNTGHCARDQTIKSDGADLILEVLSHVAQTLGGLHL